MIENEPTDNKPATQGVTFTAEQQAKIDEIVKKAMGRAGKDAREQLDIERAEKSRLTADLQAAKDALANATNTEERDRLAAEVQQLSSELTNEKSMRITAEQRATTYRRDKFIAEACIAHDFVDVETVAALTEASLAWDEEKLSFTVVNSDATPTEFFTDFAKNKPYLVKSTTKAGSGSGDSSRSGLPTGQQRYKAEDVFGRNSSSKLANDLARRDPQEYKRLKSEARNKKLI
jgi:hypothetical protein